ncbi:hypothetical protein FHW68_005484 [Pseudomonas sp. Tn43]|uniref:hypothetical protein n=1 Tax=Pseudomonas sp. Tn43 TaxID=701213 RepID=UPI00161D6ADD|nr:hypothetical protein [Pseudomonas sp. Tn43]MBB3243899.1 hypothetical protein [Pseudomonas sp. Tn43]
MAIHDDDSLAKILGDTRCNSRHDTWLWLYLNIQNAGFSLDEFNGPSMRNRMAEFISRVPAATQAIEHEKNRLLLPEKHLEWITKDERQHKWLIPHLQQAHGAAYFFCPPRLLGREFVVATIDIWNMDLAQKKAALNGIEHSWNQHKQQDHIFRWFNDKHTSQRCALAWEWLCKNKPLLTLGKAPINSHIELLMFFDQTPFSEAEKILCIETIKKRWSQQKYREKLTGKKQQNFILSDKAISHLDALAETYDLKRAQVLEALLQMETELGIYIPERVKRARSL